MAFRGRATFISALLWLSPGCGSSPTPTDQLPAIKAASFTFPALASVMAEVVRIKEFDRARGFRLEARRFGTVAGYYAALSRGEVDTAAGGPLVFQRMRSQGIPVVITNTYATMASLVVIARSRSIRRLADLTGHMLAADMASSEYSLLRVLAQRQGIQLGEQIRVLQATPAVGRAHLMTGEADAILTFEPTATLVLLDQPDHHVIFQGLEAWLELNLGEGWLLVSLFHESFAAREPDLVEAFRFALQDAAAFVHQQPEAADRLLSDALPLPSGVFLRAVQEGRIQFDVRSAASERESLIEIFRFGLHLGFSDHLPPPEAIFSPAPAPTGE